MLNRAYSVLHVRSIDAEKRTFSGMATTPSLDRVGDVVEPGGAKFSNPLTLLLFHDHTRPVGTVRLGKATDEGIPFTASIPEIFEDGDLKRRVDEAWQLVRAKIIRGVSIGFRVLDDGVELLRTGGLRFTKTEILELSLVSVSANADALIDANTIKSLDAPHLAASGAGAEVVSSTSQAGVTAKPAVQRKDARPMANKTTTEQIASCEAKRAADSARMTELMTKASDEGTTLDDAQSEEYDGLELEVKKIDAHLVRLRALEEANKAAAVPVVATTTKDASASRGGAHVVTVREKELPPGIGFAQAVLCKLTSFLEGQKGNYISAAEIAKQRYPSNPRIQQYLMQKSAVAGGTTTDSTWAAPLLADPSSLEGEFLEYLRPRTIVGQFGMNGIPALRRVPFNVKIQSQTTGGSASWVGEGKSKPVTKFQYASTTLLFTKIAAISVITEELARFSQPGAEGLVRDALAEAVIERMDRDFIDPDKAAVSGVNPASITNGVTALTSAGTSAANVLTDLQNLLETFILSNVNPQNVVLIMPNTLALVLSLTENSLGQPAFAGVTMNGGTLRGLPVITSQYAASGASYGNMIVAVNAKDIALADDGQVNVDVSREASIQMDDAPSMDSTAGTGASVVSMWQTNSVALRAERTINWKKLRTNAVAFIDDVNWGAIGSPF